MKFRSHITFVMILLTTFVTGSIVYAAPVRKKLAVQASRIIPITGKDIKNGVILIEDGSIRAVGTDVEIPWDAFVIEARNQVVMPGFVMAHTSSGLDRENENMQEVPFISTFD